jgi:hypothetical protein
MTLVRIVFVALALLVPTAWTLAKAAEEGAPAETKSGKSSKKGKKGKKPDGGAESKGDAEPSK